MSRGMRSIRSTLDEDLDTMLYEESKKDVVESNDVFIDAREATSKIKIGGLIELAEMLEL